jgi:hypothetical protein
VQSSFCERPRIHSARSEDMKKIGLLTELATSDELCSKIASRERERIAAHAASPNKDEIEAATRLVSNMYS